jgi:hypothetical protein
MMRRNLAVIALLLAVATAGCDKSNDPTVASAGPGSGTASATAAPADATSNLKYSQCMRGQGLTWFPDPNADGSLQVHVPDGADEQFKKAAQACKAYDPGSSQNHKISPADLAKLQQVAQCMRDNGYPKYPDPDQYGRTRIDSSAGLNQHDPAFQKAAAKCRTSLPSRASGADS